MLKSVRARIKRVGTAVVRIWGARSRSRAIAHLNAAQEELFLARLGPHTNKRRSLVVKIPTIQAWYTLTAIIQEVLPWVKYAGKSIVKPVGEVICIRKFPNLSDDTLTNQMLVCNVDVYYWALSMPLHCHWRLVGTTGRLPRIITHVVTGCRTFRRQDVS